MSTRRLHFPGLLAILFAIAAQLGAGAVVIPNSPRLHALRGPTLQLADVPICHLGTHLGTPEPPAPHAPLQSHECALCPLCFMAQTASIPLLPVAMLTLRPSLYAVRRVELPPPATAPPPNPRPPIQPRAPPHGS
jgi:hypothetical protein